MSPISPYRTSLLLCCLVVSLLALFIWPMSPLSVTSAEPEPAQLSVASFEQLETGCREDVATYATGSHGNGSYTQVSFIETGTETANISARTERTSPVGADLTTFRVYIDSAEQPQENTSCTMGVQYRLELTYDQAASNGLLSGDDGTRVLWLENGEYSGCDSTTSGSLDAECHRFMTDNQSNKTWATTAPQ